MAQSHSLLTKKTFCLTGINPVARSKSLTSETSCLNQRHPHQTTKACASQRWSLCLKQSTHIRQPKTLWLNQRHSRQTKKPWAPHSACYQHLTYKLMSVSFTHVTQQTMNISESRSTIKFNTFYRVEIHGATNHVDSSLLSRPTTKINWIWASKIRWKWIIDPWESFIDSRALCYLTDCATPEANLQLKNRS